MKTLLLVVIVLCGAIGLGFYRGWFSFESNSSGAKSNVTMTVDQDKFREDRKTAMESVQGLGRQAKDKDARPAEIVSDGRVVSLNARELTITDRDGNKHRHTLAPDVKVTCDARTCEAADLKEGMRVRLTMGSDAERTVTRVEALNNDRTFE